MQEVSVNSTTIKVYPPRKNDHPLFWKNPVEDHNDLLDLQKIELLHKSNLMLTLKDSVTEQPLILIHKIFQKIKLILPPTLKKHASFLLMEAFIEEKALFME